MQRKGICACCYTFHCFNQTKHDILAITFSCSEAHSGSESQQHRHMMSLIDWMSDTRSQGYPDLQSLVECRQHMWGICLVQLCYITEVSPFIEGLHGNVFQDESTADHEDGSSQADGTCTAKIEAVGLVTPGAALDEVNHNYRGSCIQGAVHGAHGCSQDTGDDYPSDTCTSPFCSLRVAMMVKSQQLCCGQVVLTAWGC